MDFKGMKWKELKKEEQENLLKQANPIDGRTGSEMEEDGECIIDFEEYSVSGEVIDGEIIIEDEKMLYNPEDGVVTKWESRIRLARKRARFETQRQMSEHLNIPESTIKDWERGARTPSEWVCDLLVEKLNNIARSTEE